MIQYNQSEGKEITENMQVFKIVNMKEKMHSTKGNLSLVMNREKDNIFENIINIIFLLKNDCEVLT